MIQRGLFVILLKNHEMHEVIIKKWFWSIGKTVFRALAWLPEALNEEILALSSSRCMIIKKVPPKICNFIPLLLDPYERVIKIDNTKSPLPHSNIRALVSLTPGVNIPDWTLLKLDGRDVKCAI